MLLQTGYRSITDGFLQKSEQSSVAIEIVDRSALPTSTCEALARGRFFVDMDIQRLSLYWVGAEISAILGFQALDATYRVTQIQGSRDATRPPKNWAKDMLSDLLFEASIQQVTTVGIVPARLNSWWRDEYQCKTGEEMNLLRGRLRTYYDRVPKQLGFSMADPGLVKAWSNLPHIRSHKDMPLHSKIIGTPP